MSAQQPDARLIYARTDAGEAEAGEPALDIGQASRRILALIGGHRSVGDLAQFARPGELLAIVAELERHGLIEVVGVAREPSEVERRAQRAAEQALLGAAKKSLGGVFCSELGNAGQIWDARVADCVNMEVLRRVLREAVDVVNARNGEDAARRIIAAVRPIFEAAREGVARR